MSNIISGNVIYENHIVNIEFSVELLEKIKKQSADAVSELCDNARLREGAIFIVGCSSSEVAGELIGTFSSPDIASAIYDGVQSILVPRKIRLAAQCCEHLNRAVIIDGFYPDAVNVVPQPKAGGSFATAAYNSFSHPTALETIKADAGIDIGGTLIGMHLKHVAVPVRLATKHIGNAVVIAARTRPKFIGGIRAAYDESLL